MEMSILNRELKKKQFLNQMVDLGTVSLLVGMFGTVVCCFGFCKYQRMREQEDYIRELTEEPRPSAPPFIRESSGYFALPAIPEDEPS